MSPDAFVQLHEQCSTVEETAKALGLSVRYIRALCSKKKLRAEKIADTWFIYKESIEEYNGIADILSSKDKVIPPLS